MDALRAEAVGDWQPCGDCFYSRELLCDMQWEQLDLEGKRLACAALGGPIAVIRDERQMVVVTGDTVQPLVRTFTAAGSPLGSFLWDSPSRLLEWGWTSTWQLACVEGTAMVTLRSLTGDKVKEMSLGPEPAAQGLTAAVLAGDSLAVVSRGMGVWGVPDLTAPRTIRLATPPVADELADACCMAVLQPHQTMSGSMEVLLSAGGSVLYQLDEDTCVEHSLGLQPPSHITQLRVSPCGAFIALLTADGRLVVMASDMSRRLSEFETHADTPPLAVEWCGSDALVVQWPQLILLVGPYGDHVSWQTHEETVVLSPEVDGVRVIGSMRHELIRKVPASVAEVFRPGSTSPPTQLWDARSLLDAGNARCDKILRTLGVQLPSAVTTCIEAAGHDLSPARQRALLRSAAYGRTFCGPSFPAQQMALTAHTLRLLNSLRDPRCAMPLTITQLHALGIPAVLARLALYKQWLMAYRIAESLTFAAPQILAPPHTHSPTPHTHTRPVTPPPASPLDTFAPTTNELPAITALGRLGTSLVFPTPSAYTHTDAGPAGSTAQGQGGQAVTPVALQEAILTAWACATISAAARSAGSAVALSDGEVKERLMSKLRQCPGIRYAPLAAHAQAVGRRRLALLLLEEETSCALQVPLLLSLATGATGSKSIGGRPDDTSDDTSESEDALSRALRRAIESGDTDLVYHVLFHIYRVKPASDFWALVSSRALARNLFVKFCKAREPELLETLLTTTGQSTELAELKVIMALRSWAEALARYQAGDTALHSLVTALNFAASKYTMSRDHLFQSKAMTDLAALRKEQARLEKETGQHLLVGLSLGATLQELIRLGHHKHALALRKQFAVSDRHFWWLKIRALAEARSWDALDAFAGEKKSPIGYEPFLEVAKRFGAPREVQARLIARLPDSASKAEAYSAIEMAKEAAEVAARIRDGDLLRRISGAVSAASPAGLAIAQIKERFFAGAGAGASR